MNNGYFFSYTIMFSYNFRNRYALLSYMEYPIILIQEIVLIIFVMYYKSCLNVYSLVGAAIYGLIAAGLLLGTVPLGVIAFVVVGFQISIQIKVLVYILATLHPYWCFIKGCAALGDFTDKKLRISKRSYMVYIGFYKF